MKYVDVEHFESQRIRKTADFIKSLHSNLSCSTIPTEIAQSELYYPYQKGIKIAKNITEIFSKYMNMLHAAWNCIYVFIK